MTEKITGFILVAVGILIILFSAYNVIGAFTGRTEPSDIFGFSGIGLDLGNFMLGEASPEEIAMIKDQNPNLKAELIEGDVLNKPLNLFAHLMLWGFISSIGFKIAQIGATILKPIKVHLKESSVLEQVKKEIQSDKAPNIPTNPPQNQ